MARQLAGSPVRGDDGPLQILFCANSMYFQHVAVAAVSLAENNRCSDIHIHLITCDRHPVREEMLKASLLGYNSLSLTVHYASAARLDRLFVDRYLTKECYLRILAPEVLPAEIDRVIYLDCDVVVLDDLRPLWNIKLDNEAVAAAPDYPRVPLVFAPGRRRSIGIPEDWTYVNSGVLLLDLERWRQEGLTRRLIDYVESQGSALALHDQDAINAVLHDAIYLVDCRWNLQARIYRSGRRSFSMELEATREARRRPAIIHYTGSEKPWLFRSRTARKQDYFRYLNKTAWRDVKPPLATTMQRVEYAIDRFLSSAGIDYLEILHKVLRAPAKLGSFVAALSHRTFRPISLFVRKAGAARGAGR